MTIRYSGDTEVRLGYDARRRAYIGTVVDPFLRWRGAIPQVAIRHSTGRTSPEAYDAAAHALLKQAMAWAKKSLGKKFMVDLRNRRIRLNRVFQAPCPLE